MWLATWAGGAGARFKSLALAFAEELLSLCQNRALECSFRTLAGVPTYVKPDRSRHALNWSDDNATTEWHEPWWMR